MKMILLDGYNCNIRPCADVIGTIVPNNNRWGLTNGWKIIEIYEDEIQTGEEKGRKELGGIPV